MTKNRPYAVIKDADGIMYLYDLVNIKKEASTPL